METDLIITGVGLSCGLGVGVQRCWEQLCAGASGLRPLTGIDAGATARGAEVPASGEPEPTDRRDRAHAHLVTVCLEALTWAGIDGGQAPVPERASLFLGSTLAVRSAPGRGAYAAAKAAQLSLSRTLALELAARDVRVNSVLCGVVPTPMTAGHDLDDLAPLHPLGLGTPEAVASLVLAVLENPWMTGAAVPVDGGLLAT